MIAENALEELAGEAYQHGYLDVNKLRPALLRVLALTMAEIEYIQRIKPLAPDEKADVHALVMALWWIDCCEAFTGE